MRVECACVSTRRACAVTLVVAIVACADMLCAHSMSAGVEVDITLTPVNNGNGSSAALADCSADQRAALSLMRCRVLTGDAAAAGRCQLSLPCPGEFEIVGCTRSASLGSDTTGARSSSSNSCSTPLRLGRNLTMWQAAPWSSPPQLVLLPDRTVLTQDGRVTLSLQNPGFGPASGLLLWGNGAKRLTHMLPAIPRGPSSVTISGLGEECAGGCRFALLLATARAGNSSSVRSSSNSSLPRRLLAEDSTASVSLLQPSGSSSSSAGDAAEALAPLPAVPTSLLYDPRAPYTAWADVSVQGPPAPELAVTLSVTGGGDGGPGVNSSVPILVPKV